MDNIKFNLVEDKEAKYDLLVKLMVNYAYDYVKQQD